MQTDKNLFYDVKNSRFKIYFVNETQNLHVIIDTVVLCYLYAT